MAEINEKMLWMRNVDFKRLKDFYLYIQEHGGEFKPMELEKAASESGFFLKDGKNFGHTTKFNYRKILENLDLIELIGGKYYIKRSFESDLILNSSTIGTSLSNGAIEGFRRKFLYNNDCRNMFFNLFHDHNQYTYMNFFCSLYYIIVKHDISMQAKNNKSFRKIILQSSSLKSKIELDSMDKIQGIFWGLRKWALDFSLTDEIITSTTSGRYIYPIYNDLSKDDLRQFLMNEILRYANQPSLWISLHIPTFLKHIIESQTRRPSVKSIKDFLFETAMENPQSIFLVSTSSSIIENQIPFEKQDEAYRKCFIHIPDKGYISHLKIHKHFGGYLL